MRRRQAMPSLWLMTDERLGDDLHPAIARLPRGAGIVFRHYRTPPADRRALYEQVRVVARRRGLVLVLAGDVRTAIAWKADGVHGAAARSHRRLIRTLAAHDAPELIRAGRSRADLVFLSPVFATRSHPGAPTLGPVRFGLLSCPVALPVIALGGMDADRFRRVSAIGAAGWAAIDAWTGPRQKRNVVPR